MSDSADGGPERRYRIAAPVEYACLDPIHSGRGRLRDISVSGMYVADGDHDLKPGVVLRAALSLFDSDSVFLEGEVVRAEAEGFAVRFQGLDVRTEAILSHALPLAEERQRRGEP